MPATVQIAEKNGAGGTLTNKTSGTVRFKKADNATVDLINPLVIPGAGFDYSIEKWLRANVTVAPSTQISDLKFYSDGANGMGTGVEVYAKAVASFATPALATSTTGYVDFFTYTSGSPLSLGAGPFTGTGEKGDHAVLMSRCGTTATPGVTASENATLEYTEI